MSVEVCPGCGGNMHSDWARRSIESYLAEMGVSQVMVDPGGREVVLKDGTRLRLSDYCDTCDLVVVQDEFARRTTDSGEGEA